MFYIFSDIRRETIKEIVFPKRLNTYDNHDNHINKRSTRNNQKIVSYSISAFGNDFLLDLTFTKDLIPNNYVVQTFGDNFTRIEDKSSDQEQCFYRGSIQNAGPSWAVFNLCNGLVSPLLVVRKDMTHFTILLQRCKTLPINFVTFLCISY